MRTVFFGTPEIAVPTLRAMAASRFAPLAVFTQPQARRGRGGEAASGPVGTCARELGLELHEVESVNEGEALARLTALAPDVIVVVAFGQILKKAVLNLPQYGCLNFHPSMLPKYRGAAPVQRAVMDGVAESGLTIMRLVRKLDAGPVLLQQPWTLDLSRTAAELLDEAGRLGAPLMLQVLERLPSLTPVPQDDAKATFAPPLEKHEGELRFDVPASALVNRVRAVQPWPKASALLRAGGRDHRVIVWQARIGTGSGAPGAILGVSADGITVACADGAVLLSELQLEGKPRRHARDVANGLRLGAADHFVNPEPSHGA